MKIIDVVSAVHTCKTTVVSDVSFIHALITSVRTTAVGQKWLAEEIVKVLKHIVSVLTVAVNGVSGRTLPAVVKIVVTEVTDIITILSDAKTIVLQIVQVLSDLGGSL
ncbi:hypothetical protein OCU04_007613 [Sclerotinia nivalis]|uniref:Uncharacterized protein n=1 Tax=Sclerotinia nivalis TaxID=352851 RepID=A0A9X0DIL0_9HELO|nr:hypothetical protein OCU04_007613 [Sclerotinia nivalis]